MEALDARRLFAVDVSVVGTATLRISGDANDNLVLVRENFDDPQNPLFEVSVENVMVWSAAWSSICDIEIFGNGGNDNLEVTFDIAIPAIIDGGNGDDSLAGGAAADEITGGPGDDSIYGRAGNDTLSGGAGEDLIAGDDGNDTISGGDDDDWSLGGGNGDDTINGGAGVDHIWGEAGDDVLLGLSGNDTISGGDDDDTIDGGAGEDTLLGDDGNDTFLNLQDLFVDVIYGGPGTDLASGFDNGYGDIFDWFPESDVEGLD